MITNYATLQTYILNTLVRVGETDATERVKEWIQLAEDELRMKMSELMLSDAETEDTAFYLSTEYTNLPTGFISERVLALNGNNPVTIDFMSPQMFERQYQYDQAGTPLIATIQANRLHVKPVPDTNYQCTFLYYSLPNLSDAVTTNWLITNHPKLYMVSTKAEAYEYYEEYDKANAVRADIERMINNLEITEGPSATVSSLRMRVDGGTP